MGEEKTGRYNVSMPSWFHRRATARADALGKKFAEYVRDLVRADMARAGLDVAPPKSAKRRGARS